jgi:hypothetical protein
MTYYIAYKIGFGDLDTEYRFKNEKNDQQFVGRSDAFWIAWACQYVDENPTTGPLSPSVLVDNSQLYKYHFRAANGEMVKRGSDIAKQPALDAVNTHNLMLLGIGLHALQDSYSHEGYAPPLGHAQEGYGGHYPDYPWSDVPKALQMAKATYDVLADYYKKWTGKTPKTAFGQIEPTIKRLFDKEGDPQLLREYERLVAKDALNATVTELFSSRWKKETAGRVQLWKQLLQDEGITQTGYVRPSKLSPINQKSMPTNFDSLPKYGSNKDWEAAFYGAARYNVTDPRK